MLECAKHVYENNFKVDPNRDKVLIFFDEISIARIGEVVEAFVRSASELGLEFLSVGFKSTGSHGNEPPIDLWRILFGGEFCDMLVKLGLVDKLLAKELRENVVDEFIEKAELNYNVIVALSYYSTTHTIFRSIATKLGARYASMPNFDKDMLCGSVMVPVEEIKEITSKVANLLNEADTVIVEAPNGTHLEMSIYGRFCKEDDGDFSQPSSYGNLPAGEAFIAPVEGTTCGVLVIECAGEKRFDSPLYCEIKDGVVVSFSPKDHEFAVFLDEVFRKYPLARNIAEFGVGTNRKAKNPVNVLEAEKILGTVHVAFGDNAGFGGTVRVPFHMDFVVFNPTLKAKVGGEWKSILERGKLTV